MSTRDLYLLLLPARKLRHVSIFACWSVLLALLPVFPAAAQDPLSSEPRYGAWEPAAESNDAQQLVDELRALVDEAERMRAADPRFLDDLRNLAARYERPWRVPQLSDDFGDGDFTRDPVWTVVSGEWRVEPRYGIRSIVCGSQSAPSSEAQDPAAALLGTLLQGITREPGSNSGATSATGEAVIHIAQPITNAFALRFDIWASGEGEGLEIGMYRGDYGGQGYRLRLAPAADPTAALYRISSRGGRGLVESHIDPLVLEDGRRHEVEWTRRPDGQMSVSIDGTEILTAFDRGYVEDWDGMALFNRGGDVTLGRIAVDGTR